MSAPTDDIWAQGFVALPRRAVDLINDPLTLAVYGVVLRRARHEPGDVLTDRGTIPLDVGQCVVGRDELARRFGVSADKVRASITRLRKLRLITSKSTNKGTVVSLVNPARYVGRPDENPQQNPQQEYGIPAESPAKPPANPQQNPQQIPSNQGAQRPGPKRVSDDAGRTAPSKPPADAPANPQQSARNIPTKNSLTSGTAEPLDPSDRAREVPHLPSDAELRREAVKLAEEVYRYLLKQVGELQMDQVPGMPRIWPTPGGQLEDAGIVTAAAKYTAEQLRHVIDYRVAEARQKRDGERLNPSSLFHPKAIAFALGAPPIAKTSGTNVQPRLRVVNDMLP